MSNIKIVTLIGFFTMFIVGVSDLIVVGMLNEMSKEFHVSNALIGQLVTLYAVAFSILSPLLTKVTSQINDKKLLVSCLILFIIFSMLTTVMTNYFFLCIVRIFMAGIASLITVKLMSTGANIVPVEYKASVIANIYVGFSAANILGIPIGTLIASHYNWKIPFYIIAIITFLCLLGIMLFIPNKSHYSINNHSKYQLVNFRGTLIMLGFLLIMMISNSIWIVSLCLFFSGIAGVLGSKLGNNLTEKKGYRIAGNIIIIVYIISIMSILLTGQNVILLILSIFTWNLFHWGTNPTVQYALLKFLKGDPSQILSYDISILNLGIGLGSLIGGILFSIDNQFNLSIVVAMILAMVSSILLKTAVHTEKN
ncbi:MFS transporter [Staphylococcus aureus]|nr:MFS transporter [Staphylococcus aureus]